MEKFLLYLDKTPRVGEVVKVKSTRFGVKREMRIDHVEQVKQEEEGVRVKGRWTEIARI